MNKDTFPRWLPAPLPINHRIICSPSVCDVLHTLLFVKTRRAELSEGFVLSQCLTSLLLSCSACLAVGCSSSLLYDWWMRKWENWELSKKNNNKKNVIVMDWCTSVPSLRFCPPLCFQCFPTMDDTADLSSAPDLWHIDDFSINMTAANTSSIPTTFLSPVMDKTINILMVIVLFITMVSLGCTMEVSKIKVTMTLSSPLSV